ncbi:MAG: hypothetical protein ABIG64_06460 [Candidatus Omnitrophota bacterium]
MRLSVLNSKETLYDKDAKSVVLPGEDGQLCVMDYHEPFLYKLKDGQMLIDNKFAINIVGGVARMKGNELVILLER